MATAWSEKESTRMLACVKTLARELAHECRVCIDGEQDGWPADWSVIARNEDMYCEQNVNNSRYESIGKLYSKL